MKVGDLVKCVPADGHLGLIVRKRPKYRGFIYDVVLPAGTFPFLPSQLEVINESR